MLYIHLLYIMLIIAYILSIFINQKILEIAKLLYYKVLQVVRLFYCKILKYKLKLCKRNFDFKNNFKKSDNFI